MQIKEIESPVELEAVFPVLKELRTELTYDEFLRVFEEASLRDDYRFLGAFEGIRCLGVAGFRVLHDYVHGRHVYVDDLVVTESHRSQGLGAVLLEAVEKEARVLGCEKIRLCTGTENHAGKRFYERHGWNLRAIVYKKTLT